MTTTPDEPVGLIGVGLLGAALAECLIGHGFQVAGYDPIAERRTALRQLGGVAVGSTQEVAQRCNRILLSLPNSNVAARVLTELAHQTRNEAIIIDTTTGDPEEIASFGRTSESLGFHYLDATIAGSSKQVREHDVLVMVGGRREDFDRCTDIFSTFAREPYYLGAAGSGARMKLVTNMVLGLNRAVLAEALAFSAALGFDPQLTLSILKSSSSYSRVMDIKGEKMLKADYAVEARLSQHLKDVRLMLEAAERFGARLPLTEIHRRLLEEAESGGWGDSDNSAILELFKR
jgi:3-hydroxyisobutyrate dehydrogenase-like beta-hydroxyacid dehydrogenase